VSKRDRGLDLLRGLALGRVFLWHATGFAVLTWVAALPVMVFVSGMLIGTSVAARGGVAVFADRLRRLLVPLWAFSVTAWIVMGAASVSARQAVPWAQIPAWFFPLTDPVGTEWEGGWLSEPLWYLRLLLWLFMALPVLTLLARRAPFVASLVLGGAVVLFELTAGSRWWAAQDLVMFAVFFIAGIATSAGTLPKFGPRWGVLVPCGVAGAAGWVIWQGAGSGVVNDSHSLHLMVGAATLGVCGMSLGLLRRAAARLSRPVDIVARRSLTIYLWHPAAIALVMVLTKPARSWLGDGVAVRVAVAAAALGLCAAIVPLFAHIEDWAARRTVVRPDVRFAGAAAAVVVALVAVQSVVPHGQGNAFTLPPPSQDPLAADYSAVLDDPALPLTTADTETSTRGASLTFTELGPQLTPGSAADTMQELVEQYSAAHHAAGVGVVVVRPGVLVWASGAGESPIGKDDPFGVMSITKSFTGALVLRAAGDGLLELDEPIGELKSAPWLDVAEAVTWRQLLNHTSGLVAYAATPEAKADIQSIDSWEAALRPVQAAGPLWAPGTQSGYSSTNYMVAAVALSDLYGKPIEDLIRDELLGPRALEDTEVGEPSPGSPATGTGGMRSTMADLARWTIDMYRNGIGLDVHARAALLDVDPDSLFGPASWAYCPCGVDGDGVKRQAAIGYSGGTSTMRYYPGWDVVVVMSAAGSIWDKGVPPALDTFAADLAEVAGRWEPPTAEFRAGMSRRR
jgi:CubicO group peptidase (beta-lactamase class C family)/peptidoglycan/LPS O-acetylase OafA/YrhL